MTFLPPRVGRDEPDERGAAPLDHLAARRARALSSRPEGAHKSNLPHAASDFVGRREEIVEVGALLDDARLVTLTGPGGMGKTRLALEVGRRAAFRYPDGVWLVELGPLTGAIAIGAAVADAIPARGHRADPRAREDVFQRIGDRRLLLVLDSCEHLVEACAHLAEDLLRSCPALDVLVTSREGLGIVGERNWMVRPLTQPDPDHVTSETVVDSEAGQLFLRRATDASPGFRLSDANAPTVAEICRRLDGLPLAIELAAMRTSSLSPADILERLEDRFRLLTSRRRTAPGRHQTLLAALESSHALLTPGEAALLRRLSVFAGWSLATAEQVCADDDLNPADIVDLLAALVNKSLVVASEADDGIRYHMLETIRVWADAKLAAAPECISTHLAHATWCVELAEGADEKLGDRHPKPWIDDLAREHDNLRFALDWARTGGDLETGIRLVTALAHFWRLRGHIAEGQRWLEWAVVASAGLPPTLRAKALRAAGLLRGQLGDIVSALPLLEESSALYAEIGDHDASLCACRPTFLMSRNPRQALPLLRERAAACRHSGDTTGLAHLLHSIGQVHYVLGGCDEASSCFQECLQLGRGAADGEALRSGLLGAARVDLLRGDLIAAEGWAAEARVEADAAVDDYDAATALGVLGDVARARGRWELARSLLTDALERARVSGIPIGTARSVYLLARLAESEGDAEAGALYERSLALSQVGEAPVFHEIRCRLGLGTAAEAEGDPSGAAGHLLEALEMAQGVGDLAASAEALLRLSRIASRQGKATEASLLGRRSLELYHQVGALPGIATALESLAGISAEARPELAVRLLAAAGALRQPQGYARARPEQARFERDLDMVRSSLPADVFEAEWASGATLSVGEAVAYALRGQRSGDRPASGLDSLTSAEREVVRLVCQGLTNPEVGRRLFISPRTVGHHLTHVFDKLGIRSRGALTKELAGREI